MPQLKQKDFDLELKYLELKGENILRNQSLSGNSTEATSKEEPCDSYISMLIQIQVHKWNCKIDLIIQDEKFENSPNRFKSKFKLYTRRINTYKIL